MIRKSANPNLEKVPGNNTICKQHPRYINLIIDVKFSHVRSGRMVVVERRSLNCKLTIASPDLACLAIN